MTILIPNEVSVILRTLEKSGYEAYVVGGCVRDTILGIRPHDWDISTSASPEQVISIFGKNCIKETGGLKYGTVCLYTNECGLVELTTFRTEGKYSDGRRPDTIAFSANIHEDLKRRDFTMNTLAYHPDMGLIDDFRGLDDIKEKVIRCVGNANERFAEDPLRLLRAMRFQAKTGFRIERPTKAAMKKNVKLLSTVSYERVMSEMRSAINGAYAMQALKGNSFVLCQIVPEFSSTIGCKQNNPWHLYDVFEHSLRAVNAAACMRADEITRMALLFHDIGKPACLTTDDEGIDHFKGHCQVSAEITRNTLHRLCFPKRYIDSVCELVAVHDSELTPTLPAARRWLNRLGEEQLRRLTIIRECDSLAQSNLAVNIITNLGKFSSCVEQVILDKNCFTKKDLAISGKDLIEMGISPGPNMGKIFDALLQEVMDAVTKNDAESLKNRSKELSAT